MQFPTQSDHFTHNNHGRRLELCVASEISDCLHSPKEALLRRSCSGVDQRYRTLRVASAFQKSVHDLFQIMHAHEDNEGVYAAHELTPLDLIAALGCLVAGYDGNAGRARTVSNRYTGVCGSGNRRTDARDDLIGNSSVFQSGRLFTSPAEHERISALEPDYQLAFARFANEKLLDLSLISTVLTGLLADVNQFSAWRSVFQQ